MSTETPDLQPDISEVIQEEPPYDDDSPIPVVDVAICGPVRTQRLPRKGGATKTVSLGTEVRRVLTADPRRGKAWLVSHDQDFLVAYSKASATDDASMARIPKQVLFPITASVDVYVRAQTGTTTLSVVQEAWAEGDG